MQDVKNIHDLANFYREDLYASLKYSLKPNVTFNLKTITTGHLLSDSYDQRYDSNNRLKVFKFKVEDVPVARSEKSTFKYSLLLSKFFKLGHILHNDLDYPCKIRYFVDSEELELTWYKDNEKHRTVGPAFLIYNFDLKEIINTAWFIKGKELKKSIINNWLFDNNIPDNELLLLDENLTLFKLQMDRLIQENLV